ncbi:MAG: DUF294 nucleotidyltransferase-like domain-containing protein [Pseudomonadota bacterium]
MTALMPDVEIDRIDRFFEAHHPFAMLDPATRQRLVGEAEVIRLDADAPIYAHGDPVPGLYIVAEGRVRVMTPEGVAVSSLQIGQCFGERGLLLDGIAPYDTFAAEPCLLFRIPAARFHQVMESVPGFAMFFGRRARASSGADGAAVTPAVPISSTLAELMTRNPITLPPEATAADAARAIADRGISCVLVADQERLSGLVTASDLCARVLAKGLGGDLPITKVMTAAPRSLPPDAVTFDAISIMVEKRVGHLPIVEAGKLVGIITRTDLVMSQAMSAPMVVGEVMRASTLEAMVNATHQIPEALAQLVGAGLDHQDVTRNVTDITDALTRKLITMAEAELGPAPVPYLWAVCGSQGRREQTGVSDQDNCLILDDRATADDEAYFDALAKRVSDGLDACGFFFCPGDMMATNVRWRKPMSVWRGYFRGWIDKPDPMARMLASVMFDLRAVAGEASLLEDLQAETLERAKRNSIFIAHMVANSLSHQPPLGLFRGFALSRSGEHRGTLDMKMNGVVPITDLARLYALMGGLAPVNTRSRLVAAREAGLISEAGGHDLLDAYDLISEMRLEDQAAQIRRGEKPDNYLIPAALSDLERSHLRSAFVAVKTMQSAATQGRHTMV